MEIIVSIVLFIVAARLFGFALGYVLNKLLNVRYYINRILLRNHEGMKLSSKDFFIFWASLDVIVIFAILYKYVNAVDLTWLYIVMVISFSVVFGFSIYWIIRNNLSIRSLMVMVAALVGGLIVVLTQVICVLMNVLTLITTSPNYRGRVYYLPIKPY